MKTAASMATINRPSLNNSVLSIVDQVDHIDVHNNTNEIILESFLLHERSELIEHNGNLGDRAKFLFNVEADYYLTLDDDLIYPRNYVETMVNAAKKYGVVSAHGVRFNQKKVDSYYTNKHRSKYHFSSYNAKLQEVDVIGTGCACFRKEYLPSFEIFKDVNMADLYYSKWLAEQGVKRYVIPHGLGWIKQGVNDISDSIYVNSLYNDKEQTKLVNEILSL